MQKPPPCYQDWNAMEIVDGGRICAQCDKTIVDFTKVTWENILEHQKKTQFTTCGKYSEKQITHWGYQPPRVDLAWFRKSSFTGLFILLGFKVAYAQEVEKPSIEIVGDTVQFLSDTTEKYQLANFRGVVIDSSTGESIPFVMLKTLDGKKNVYTDVDGCFKIEVNSADLNNGMLSVKLIYAGSESREYLLKKNMVNELSLSIKKLEVVIIDRSFRVADPKPTLKPIRTIKNWFKKD